MSVNERLSVKVARFGRDRGGIEAVGGEGAVSEA